VTERARTGWERESRERERDSRQSEREWEREREQGWECVCKRDRVGDGRECESVRESKWWHRELIWDGRERE